MSEQVEQDPREVEAEKVASTEVAVQAFREPQNELEHFAMDLGTAYRAARSLVTTSFVPQSYKGKPEEAAAAIMTGQEVGLSPLAALRSIDIINGVPAMRAVALRALVQSSGHEIWTTESTATRAVVKGRRKGSDNVEESIWTIDRARGLALLGKDNWKKQPIAMLLARATSELVRLIAADVILGIPYSIEEVEDFGVQQEEAPKKAPATRAVKRAVLPKAEPVPVAEPPLPGEAEPSADTATGEVKDAAGESPEFDDKLAKQIEAELAAERKAEIATEDPLPLEEPPLDEWDAPEDVR